MRIRLYFEEDSMQQALVRAWRARGVDVTTALETGIIEREDQEHLDHATAQGRVLYSFNVGDFYRLHTAYLAQGRSHSGIVLAQQQRYSVGEQLRRRLKLVATKSAEEMRKRQPLGLARDPKSSGRMAEREPTCYTLIHSSSEIPT